MKYIVTGGAGFIGSNLVDLLIKEGHDVHVIDNFSSGKKENCNEKAQYFELDISDKCDEEDDTNVHVFDNNVSRKKVREFGNKNRKGASWYLKNSNVPSSICRLIVDLLGDADAEYNTEPLFRRDDDSLPSIADAIFTVR